MNMNGFLKKNWIHFVAIFLFFIVGYIYFSPQFDGHSLKQHDIEQFKGMSNEIAHYREVHGEEPLWTNSMFGGMPAVQISVLHKGNVTRWVLTSFYKIFPSPVGVFFLHLIGFYILALCLRIKPVIAILGAFAFAFSSYEIIILQAGHNSKAVAVGLMAPVLGGFVLAYKRKMLLGIVLSALFMTFELTANHVQVTYYLIYLLVGLGVLYFINAIREKQLKRFAITTAGLIGAYILAGLINIGNLSLTNDYVKHTIRGANDVTITPDGLPSKIASGGLDKEYITQWSYGKGESFTMISPYVKGSHSMALGSSQFAEMVEDMDMPRNEKNAAMNMPMYWGEQPIVSGPFYLGIVVVFLAFLGMVFIKDKSKWVYLVVALLALLLSWGKNFMGFTEFFIDHVPGYDKFRTVTIILVLVELIIPVVAILLLQRLWEEREAIKEQKKTFLYASGIFLVFLIGYKVIGAGGNFASQADMDRVEKQRTSYITQLQGMDPAVLKAQYNLDISNPQQLDQFMEAQMEPLYLGLDGIKKVRKEMFQSSTTRSILFSIVAMGLCALFFYTSIPSMAIVTGLAALVLIDLIPVDLNYLGTEEDNRGKYVHWVPDAEYMYPMSSLTADAAIMDNEVKENPALAEVLKKAEREGSKKAAELDFTGRDKRRVIDSYKFQALNANTNYRVFDVNGGWGSSRASYFHKSLGGYHGAKLRNIQNLFEFQISQSNNKVLDMLNVKYIIQGEQMRLNPSAMGNVWLGKKVKTYATADDEIRALGKQFKLTNEGSGQFWVNGEVKKEATVYGAEELLYLTTTGDTLSVPLSNGLQKGLKALFVSDVNGKTNLIPEFTFQADTSNSFTQLVSVEVIEEFDPTTDVVMLDSEAKNVKKKEYSGEGTIAMTSYEPNKISYEATVTGDQLAVFSEIYYPEGWTATVDGKEQEILKVDYLLRGLELHDGKHKIEFSFDLPAFHSSGTLAYLGSTLLLLALGFVGYKEFKSKKGEEEDKDKA